MEDFEQWKEQVAHWWRLGLEYFRQLPPEQLYAAAAVLAFTTILLLFSKWLHPHIVALLL